MRDYQLKSILIALKSVKETGNFTGILDIAPGLGKTFIISKLYKILPENLREKIVIMSPNSAPSEALKSNLVNDFNAIIADYNTKPKIPEGVEPQHILFDKEFAFDIFANSQSTIAKSVASALKKTEYDFPTYKEIIDFTKNLELINRVKQDIETVIETKQEKVNEAKQSQDLQEIELITQLRNMSEVIQNAKGELKTEIMEVLNILFNENEKLNIKDFQSDKASDTIEKIKTKLLSKDSNNVSDLENAVDREFTCKDNGVFKSIFDKNNLKINEQNLFNCFTSNKHDYIDFVNEKYQMNFNYNIDNQDFFNQYFNDILQVYQDNGEDINNILYTSNDIMNVLMGFDFDSSNPSKLNQVLSPYLHITDITTTSQIIAAIDRGIITKSENISQSFNDIIDLLSNPEEEISNLAIKIEKGFLDTALKAFNDNEEMKNFTIHYNTNSDPQITTSDPNIVLSQDFICKYLELVNNPEQAVIKPFESDLITAIIEEVYKKKNSLFDVILFLTSSLFFKKTDQDIENDQWFSFVDIEAKDGIIFEVCKNIKNVLKIINPDEPNRGSLFKLIKGIKELKKTQENNKKMTEILETYQKKLLNLNNYVSAFSNREQIGQYFLQHQNEALNPKNDVQKFVTVYGLHLNESKLQQQDFDTYVDNSFNDTNFKGALKSFHQLVQNKKDENQFSFWKDKIQFKNNDITIPETNITYQPYMADVVPIFDLKKIHEMNELDRENLYEKLRGKTIIFDEIHLIKDEHGEILIKLQNEYNAKFILSSGSMKDIEEKKWYKEINKHTKEDGKVTVEYHDSVQFLKGKGGRRYMTPKPSIKKTEEENLRNMLVKHFSNINFRYPEFDIPLKDKNGKEIWYEETCKDGTLSLIQNKAKADKIVKIWKSAQQDQSFWKEVNQERAKKLKKFKEILSGERAVPDSVLRHRGLLNNSQNVLTANKKYINKNNVNITLPDIKAEDVLQNQKDKIRTSAVLNLYLMATTSEEEGTLREELFKLNLTVADFTEMLFNEIPTNLANNVKTIIEQKKNKFKTVLDAEKTTLIQKIDAKYQGEFEWIAEYTKSLIDGEAQVINIDWKSLIHTNHDSEDDLKNAKLKYEYGLVNYIASDKTMKHSVNFPDLKSIQFYLSTSEQLDAFTPLDVLQVVLRANRAADGKISKVKLFIDGLDPEDLKSDNIDEMFYKMMFAMGGRYPILPSDILSDKDKFESTKSSYRDFKESVKNPFHIANLYREAGEKSKEYLLKKIKDKTWVKKIKGSDNILSKEEVIKFYNSELDTKLKKDIFKECLNMSQDFPFKDFQELNKLHMFKAIFNYKGQASSFKIRNIAQSIIMTYDAYKEEGKKGSIVYYFLEKLKVSQLFNECTTKQEEFLLKNIMQFKFNPVRPNNENKTEKRIVLMNVKEKNKPVKFKRIESKNIFQSNDETTISKYPKKITIVRNKNLQDSIKYKVPASNPLTTKEKNKEILEKDLGFQLEQKIRIDYLGFYSSGLNDQYKKSFLDLFKNKEEQNIEDYRVASLMLNKFQEYSKIYPRLNDLFYKYYNQNKPKNNKGFKSTIDSLAFIENTSKSLKNNEYKEVFFEYCLRNAKYTEQEIIKSIALFNNKINYMDKERIGLFKISPEKIKIPISYNNEKNEFEFKEFTKNDLMIMIFENPNDKDTQNIIEAFEKIALDVKTFSSAMCVYFRSKAILETFAETPHKESKQRNQYTGLKHSLSFQYNKISNDMKEFLKEAQEGHPNFKRYIFNVVKTSEHISEQPFNSLGRIKRLCNVNVKQ